MLLMLVLSSFTRDYVERFHAHPERSPLILIITPADSIRPYISGANGNLGSTHVLPNDVQELQTCSPARSRWLWTRQRWLAQCERPVDRVVQMIAKANAEAADDGEPGEELQGEEEDNDDAGNYTACPNNSRSAFSKGVHADGDDLQQVLCCVVSVHLGFMHLTTVCYRTWKLLWMPSPRPFAECVGHMCRYI